MTSSSNNRTEYTVKQSVVVTPNQQNVDLCGRSICAAWFPATRSIEHCTLFREAIIGGKRVCRCRKLSP